MRKLLSILIALTFSLNLGLTISQAEAANTIGSTCKSVGQTVLQGKTKLVCKKVGGKNVWSNTQKSTTTSTPLTLLSVPKQTTLANLGFNYHANGATKIDIWEDFQCANCAKFESINKDYLATLRNDPKISITYHTLAFIGLESQIAANAVACAADESKFQEFHDLLFANQPTTKNSGVWNNDAMVSTGNSIGLTTPSFKDCLATNKYLPWLKKLNESAATKKVVATPTVLINGKQINRNTDYYDAAAFTKVVTNPASIIPGSETSTATNAPVPTKLNFSVSKDLGVEPKIGKPSGTPPASLFAGDVVVGAGPAILKNETITVNYVAMEWASGKIIQSTWSSGSRRIAMGQVISGWQKGLLGMREGGRRVIICPPDWAYGSTGNSKVGPNSTIVFVIDLQKISSS